MSADAWKDLIALVKNEADLSMLIPLMRESQRIGMEKYGVPVGATEEDWDAHLLCEMLDGMVYAQAGEDTTVWLLLNSAANIVSRRPDLLDMKRSVTRGMYRQAYEAARAVLDAITNGSVSEECRAWKALAEVEDKLPKAEKPKATTEDKALRLAEATVKRQMSTLPDGKVL